MRANPGKKLKVVIDGSIFARYPIKTHVVSERDNIESVVKKYAKPHLTKDDTLVISERIVAITQGRQYRVDDIHPGRWAVFLSKYVSRHPGGIGLASPLTMELALREVGFLRILIAAFVSAVTKPFGIKGLFYHIAGKNVNAIDGPCEYTLPPGNTSVNLGPRDPMGVAQRLSRSVGVGVVIIDANDYGVRVMGCSKGVDARLVEEIFRDNPLGQAHEKTPIAIVRQV